MTILDRIVAVKRTEITQASERLPLAALEKSISTAPAPRDFVAALGFPPEFSVSPSQKRPAELSVSGPMPLGDLHGYQEEIVDALAPIIASRGATARTKVSLPTGAGKTRVAVEAAVKYVLAADMADKYVLWVAQTDELCEQAAQ